MTAQPAPAPRARQHDILHALLRGRGLRPGEYALFFVTGEGRYLPISRPGDEVEELSGYVVDPDGRVFSFWFAWDPDADTPVLTEWEQVEPEARWQRNAEYRQARQRVGLCAD